MKMRNTLLAIALASASLGMGAVGVAADDGGTTTTCPASATFPVFLPGGIGGIGSPGLVVQGTIVTSERPGDEPGQCVGTFTLLSNGSPVAAGFLVANHSNNTVSAQFAGATFTGVVFGGTLQFTATGTDSGFGQVTVYIVTAQGCQGLTASFTETAGTFSPGAITPVACPTLG